MPILFKESFFWDSFVFLFLFLMMEYKISLPSPHLIMFIIINFVHLGISLNITKQKSF